MPHNALDIAILTLILVGPCLLLALFKKNPIAGILPSLILAIVWTLNYDWLLRHVHGSHIERYFMANVICCVLFTTCVTWWRWKWQYRWVDIFVLLLVHSYTWVSIWWGLGNALAGK